MAGRARVKGSCIGRVRLESHEVVLPLGNELDRSGLQPQGMQTVVGGDEKSPSIGTIDPEPVNVSCAQKVGKWCPGLRLRGGRRDKGQSDSGKQADGDRKQKAKVHDVPYRVAAHQKARLGNTIHWATGEVPRRSPVGQASFFRRQGRFTRRAMAVRNRRRPLRLLQRRRVPTAQAS